MPIKVEEFKWKETPTHVYVSVPLKGVQSAKADIYSNDLYIKVNYPPYIFEADLLEPIDDAASTATFGKGYVQFTLVKRDAKEWGKLQLKGDKEMLRKRREAAQAQSFEAQEKALEDERKIRHEQERAAVRQQMDFDSQQRQQLEDAKNAEKQRANDAISGIKEPGNASQSKTPKAVRSTGHISVSFTPRAFKTAARESHAAEEEEWLAKQEQARKAVAEAKRLAKENGVENDPLWLKDKGNDFFKKGDFQSAINAFTAGIELDPKMPALYSNRAACHLKFNDFYAAANDCSKALSLLTPPVEANAKSRKIAYSRRGAALAGVGDVESALLDLRQALALDADNESIQNDIKKLEAEAKKEKGTE